jgi:putative transposase
MQTIEKLKTGKFYHVYNCGINGTDIYRQKADYERFMRLYEKYIFPICETYAWVLMKNHFHLLVRVKEKIRYKYSLEDVDYDKDKFNEVRWETRSITLNDNSPPAAEADKFRGKNNLSGPQDLTGSVPKPHLHFSHLFNAYAKYYNIKYKRHGSLFERPFNRKELRNIRYFRNIVIYIHQNPVHHGFCDHAMEYGWSSYLTCISLSPTLLNRDSVIGWFDDLGNFKNKHNEILNRREIEEFLGL